MYTTDKVIHQHNASSLVSKKEYLDIALRLIFKINQKTPPYNIDVNDGTVQCSGVEITGCSIKMNNTMYGVFIQGLSLDDLEQFHGTKEKQDDALEE